MGLRFFSTKNREPHLGPFPLERLHRINLPADLSNVPAFQPLDFRNLQTPYSLVNAMGDYQAMMDVIRDGVVNPNLAAAPEDPEERSRHLKSFGYFQDASMMAVCSLPETAVLNTPTRNPDVDRLGHDIRTKQTKTLASGIDEIMAGLKESLERPPSSIEEHTHAIVILDEHLRPPKQDEPGAEWILDAQDHRSALRATETAVILASYLNALGFQGKAHTATSSDVDTNKLAVAAGLATVEENQLHAPWLGSGFGLAVVTTNMEIATDKPLAPWSEQPWFKTKGPAWWIGGHTSKNGFNRDPYAKREYVAGAHSFEKLKRVDTPTTFIDEERVARVPKRTDMFARSQFGDLGKKVQTGALGGWYARKNAPATAQRRALGAFVLLQDGVPAVSYTHLTLPTKA